MQAPAFVSSWIPSSRLHSTSVTRKACPATPSMALLSHEKLEVVSSSTDTEVARYKLEIEIPGKFSKERRRQSIQGMKQHANFPGFRKGTIPPYAMKELDRFVLQDSSDEMIKDALRELDLSKIDGDEGDPKMDFDELSSRFKSGDTFVFTCEIRTKQVTTETPVEDLEDIITTDVEVEKIDMFKDREEEAATA